MKRALIFLLLLGWSRIACAVAVDTDQLANPAQEAEARAIMQEVRCLVCQGESIADSQADYAADLRHLVRERVAAGDTPEQVKDYLVARYGDWVLLRPPVKPATWVLWLAPAGFLVIGGLVAMRLFRKQQAGKQDEDREIGA